MGNRRIAEGAYEIERDTILEEVAYLLFVGYRKDDRNRIVEGIRVAKADFSPKDWIRFSHFRLSHVVEEFYELGVP